MVNFCDVCTHDVIQVFHAKTLPSHYRETSNISQTPVGNNLIDRSDVVGASSIRAVPTTSSFSTRPGFNGLGKDNCTTGRERFKVFNFLRFILEVEGTHLLHICGLAPKAYELHVNNTVDLWCDAQTYSAQGCSRRRVRVVARNDTISIFLYIFVLSNASHITEAVYNIAINVNFDRTRQTNISQYCSMGLKHASTNLVDK